MHKVKTIGVIGGGAAGFFAALNLAIFRSDVKVIIFEKTRQPLAKVKISGGGRCNVTHHCFDPAVLSKYYPRGSDVLKRAFYTFQPTDMIEWLQERGVELKTEKDGRMFPVSNSSSTIIDCFLKLAKDLQVNIELESEITSIEKGEKSLLLHRREQEPVMCDSVLLATGGFQRSYELAKNVGHTVIDAVPSLFTFNISDPRLEDMSGVSAQSARVSLDESTLSAEGPLLITHWGLSGPSILRLSAWAARILHERKYQGTLIVHWASDHTEKDVREALVNARSEHSSKIISLTPFFGLSKKLWKRLTDFCQIEENKVFSHLSKADLHSLVQVIVNSRFSILGKSTNKDEFVTCGGIPWKEIDPKTMQSKVCPGLYFAGEVVDSDGITGGFNFQNAWTTGWIAAKAMASC
jgi:predicted Rossmann fold flavoprotein